MKVNVYVQWQIPGGGVKSEFIGQATTGMEVHAMVNRDAYAFHGPDVVVTRNGNTYSVEMNGKVDTTEWYLLEEEN